jgi:alkyl hydroperoxide reductase subunit AhpC
MVQRHHIQYMVLADPRGVIAGQFNAVDSRSGRTLPCLFVLDRSRRVRGLLRTHLPLQGYPALAANALGIAVRGRTVPASR